jgi:hypothetical protein
MFWPLRRLRFANALFAFGSAALLSIPTLAAAQSPQGGITFWFRRTSPDSTTVITAAAQPAQPQPVLPEPTAAQVAPPAEEGAKEKGAPAPAPTPGATAPAPATVIYEEKSDGDDCDKDGKPKSAWLKNPKTAFIARAGFFPMPPGVLEPSGPGYYSLLDHLTGEFREKPPQFGYPRIAIMPQGFFDSDWRYVDKDDYCPDILERLHRIHLGDNWLFATGGEFRLRYYDELNSRLSGKTNSYELTRLRVFGDLWYRDTFRIYVEMISAQSFNQDNMTPNIIDREDLGLQNAFVDLKIFEDGCCVPWYVRAGRQELYFGSQRLVSALDWANTRRTFDGVRVFRHSDDFDIDAWWSKVVVPHPNGFNGSDANQNFAGVWTEYRPTKMQMFDLYWLYLDNANVYNLKTKVPIPEGALATAPYTVHTMGFRYAGNVEQNKNILFDTENMLQLGHSGFNKGSIVAGSFTEGVGYNFSKMPWNPTVWAYFDYATGSRTVGSGQMSTFNQLYPFGHYYYGGIDYIGRDNIEDVNFHLFLYPENWITLDFQYHILTLASATDALYSSGGQVERLDPTGKAGRDVGEEFTFIANFHLTKRQDILVQFCHLWEGKFLQQTGTGARSAQTLWLLYNVRW